MGNGKSTADIRHLEPRRILVRGVNWLGDAAMTTPALQRLRERFPEAHITLLTHEKLAELWLNHPSIDEIMTFAAGESLWSVALRLRERRPSEQGVPIPTDGSGLSRTNGFREAAK